ncbi:hypothetical protein ACP4OV_001839 [Aristida adscensionis]
MGGGGEEKPFNFFQVLCVGFLPPDGHWGELAEGQHSWRSRWCCGGNSPVPNRYNKNQASEESSKCASNANQILSNSWHLRIAACTEVSDLQAAQGGSRIQWKGLYSGLAGNLAGVLPASAIFVGVYEPTKRKLLEALPENLSAVAHFRLIDVGTILQMQMLQTAGAIGGIAASIVRVPTEVVKQRMQTGQFKSAPSAVRLIVAKEGFKGLYAGYGSFLLRDLPFDAIQFCIYEQLRIGYKLLAKRELNDPENALIGAFAGAITGAVTTPLDVLKTRLMIQGQGNQYSGIVSCAQTILKEEGPKAFLKGLEPRVLWIGIGGSIFFGVLERTKSILEERRKNKLPARDAKSGLKDE